jgi:hypothetical protein
MVRFRYIAEGTPDAPLILFFGNDPVAIKGISTYFKRLSTGEISTVKVSDIPGVFSADGSDIVLALSEGDEGVSSLSKGDFNWSLTKRGWDDLVELLQPFVENTTERESRSIRYYHQFLEPQARRSRSAIQVIRGSGE